MSQQGNPAVAVIAADLQCDSDEEDWESADVDLVAAVFTLRQGADVGKQKVSKNSDVEPDSDWEPERAYVNIEKVDLPKKVTLSKSEDENSVILILIDLTSLSKGAIHNKFDRHSVNDLDAKRKMCLEISSNYDKYFNNSELIMNQTVRHCSENVWKDALESLRSEYKGHYWCPFFPPKVSV